MCTWGNICFVIDTQTSTCGTMAERCNQLPKQVCGLCFAQGHLRSSLPSNSQAKSIKMPLFDLCGIHCYRKPCSLWKGCNGDGCAKKGETYFLQLFLFQVVFTRQQELAGEQTWIRSINWEIESFAFWLNSFSSTSLWISKPSEGLVWIWIQIPRIISG